MLKRNLITALAFLAGLAAQPALPAEFSVNVSADPAKLFSLMTDITTPAAATSGEATYIKFVTTNPNPELEIRSPGRAPALLAGVPSTTSVGDPLTPVTDAIVLTEVPEFAADTYRVYQVEILYAAGQPGAAETWQVTVRQDATEKYEYFGFTGSSVDEVTRPQLEATEPVAFGQVQRNVSTDHAPVEPVNFRNRGTATARFNGASFNSNPDNIFSLLAGTVSIPDLKPGEPETPWEDSTQGLWVLARPNSLANITSGRLALNYTNVPAAGEPLLSYDPAVVNLSVDGVNLLLQILMDASGSMKMSPDGQQSTAPSGERRIDFSKDAVREINVWLDRFSDGQALVGMSSFPNSSANGNVTGSGCDDPLVCIDRIELTRADIGVFVGNTTAALAANGGTPMETGINIAQADIKANDSDEDDCLVAGSCEFRKAILMLSDGYETVPSNAVQTVGPLNDAGIAMYTIGYGPACPAANADCALSLGTSYNRPLLQELADRTGGAFIEANNPDALEDPRDATPVEAFRLKNAFKQAIAPLLGIQPVEDPIETISRGQTRSHEACIDDHAYGATFLVDWDKAQRDSIHMTLTSPVGTIYNKSSTGVTYVDDDHFAMFVLQGDLIRGRRGAGVWTMNLTGSNDIGQNESILYSVNALSQSRVAAKPNFDFVWVGGELVAELALAGVVADRFPDIEIQLDYTRPRNSLERYLAQPVERRLLQEVKLELGASREKHFSLFKNAYAQERSAVAETEQLNVRMLKAAALTRADKQFKPDNVSGRVKMTREGNKWRAVLGNVAVDGVLNFYFDLNTPQGRKSCVQREVAASRYAGLKMDAALLTNSVAWLAPTPELFFDPEAYQLASTDIPAGKTRSVARLRPEVNGIPWGIGKSMQVSVAVSQGETIGGIIDNLDGSYYQVVEHDPGARPSIQFGIGDARSEAIPISLEPGGEMPESPSWWLIVLALVLLVIVYLVLRRS